MAAGEFATLGYGDLVMSEHWRLLGPQEAADPSPPINRTKHLRLALRLLSLAAVREHARDL